MPRTATAQTDPEAGTNDVLLVGRVSGEPLERALPSGDLLVAFRVVVDRRGRDAHGSSATCDTIDCTAWTAATRRRALRLAAGDPVVVAGHLRRRFWRGPQGPASRYDVEVTAVRTPRGSGA